MPAEIAPAQIKQRREANNVSRPIFARPKTSERMVEKCETAARRPSGMAAKLLAVAQKHRLHILG